MEASKNASSRFAPYHVIFEEGRVRIYVFGRIRPILRKCDGVTVYQSGPCPRTSPKRYMDKGSRCGVFGRKMRLGSNCIRKDV